MTRASELLKRKQALGAVASYRVLAQMIGKAHMTIQKVLTETPHCYEINRDVILDDVECALNQLEAKQLQLAP